MYSYTYVERYAENVGWRDLSTAWIPALKVWVQHPYAKDPQSDENRFVKLQMQWNLHNSRVKSIISHHISICSKLPQTFPAEAGRQEASLTLVMVVLSRKYTWPSNKLSLFQKYLQRIVFGSQADSSIVGLHCCKVSFGHGQSRKNPSAGWQIPHNSGYLTLSHI